MAQRVTVKNFVRVESEHMFAAIVKQAGGTNKWSHGYTPTPIDQQPIIRMNRDTLYSAAVVDISQGATIVVPEAGDRYLSVMFVSADHFIPLVVHAGGEHHITAEQIGSDFVLVAARILVDPESPEDVAAVNSLQNALEIRSTANQEFVLPEYDPATYKETRDAVLALARGLDGFDGSFGSKDEVEPVMHLLGAAAGWGGLPTQEAKYLNVDPKLPVGDYSLTVKDVPVDGFWSISLYNREGFFEQNDKGAYAINSITAEPNADGSITVNFGGNLDRPNTLPIMDGWNYLVRLYQARPEILDGTWTFPTIS